MSGKTILSDEARHLALVPLFGQLDEHELAKLAEEVDQVSFESGEAIFREFDQGDALYVIEQDFKVNLKSELMLDDLIRKDKERSAQMEQLIGVMKSNREANLVDGEDYVGAAVDHRVGPVSL